MAQLSHTVYSLAYSSLLASIYWLKWLVRLETSSFCYTKILASHWGSSCISYCPVPWTSCCFGSVGLPPSYSVPVHRFGGSDGPDSRPVYHGHCPGELSSTALATSTGVAWSKELSLLSNSHVLRSSSSTLTTTRPTLLFGPGEVQGPLSRLL